MATPLLSALKTRWPKTRVTVMILESLAPLFATDTRIDEILAFKKPQGFIKKMEATDIIERVREGNYEMAILLTNSFSSAWWFKRAGIKTLIGFGRRWLLSHSLPFPPDYQKKHLVLSYLDLLKPLGIKSSSPSLELMISREEKENALAKVQSLLGPGQLVIGLNPGAAYGSAKCWPPASFRTLIQKLLQEPKISILVFGDQTQRALVQDITAGFATRVVNLAGKTDLRELLAFISVCHLFITNDSGPMHIAAALQVPLLALFGSTSDLMTGPYRTGEVIHKRVSCSPCYLRTCPLDFRCMKEITPEEVANKAFALLRNK